MGLAGIEGEGGRGERGLPGGGMGGGLRCFYEGLAGWMIVLMKMIIKGETKGSETGWALWKSVCGRRRNLCDGLEV